jgi:tRNA modification GTPase
VRLSGPEAWRILSRYFAPDLPSTQNAFPPTALSGALSLPQLHTTLQATLYLSRAPRSYTGQDLIEVHTIGSAPLLQLILSTFVAAGARYAAAGEFTMRAFLNRKLDLTAAEAILSLIDATDTRQANNALLQMAGGIARPIHTLRNQLLDLIADLEAGLDFADEDLQFIERRRLIETLSDASRQLDQMSRQMEHRSLSCDSLRVILCGPPNAGKSSLFNALLGRQAALVSNMPGTTRDYLVAPLALPHGTIELVDTAGIEHTVDAIAQSAHNARERAAASANLILWCDDRSSPLPDASPPHVPPGAQMIFIHTKADLRSTPYPGRERNETFPAGNGARMNSVISVSTVTRHGLDHLVRAIDDWAQELGHAECGIVASTATRCRNAIVAAAQSIRRAIEHASVGASDELTSMDLRLALDELGQVIGAVYTDDILDRVFSRFCIGK